MTSKHTSVLVQPKSFESAVLGLEACLACVNHSKTYQQKNGAHILQKFAGNAEWWQWLSGE